MKPSPQRNIEDVLCFKARLKILELLMDSQLTPPEIARAVGTNYMMTEQHLEVLEAEGVLRYMRFGNRIRYYRFNEGSPRARAAKNLIGIFENALQIRENKKATQCLTAV